MSNDLPDGYRWVKWRVRKCYGNWVYYNVNAPIDTLLSADSWEQAVKNARLYSRYTWTVNVERQ